METRQAAPFTKTEIFSRGIILAIAIREIPLTDRWSIRAAAMANEYLKSPLFEKANQEFDQARMEQEIRELESSGDQGIGAYESLLSELKDKTGLDPIQASLTTSCRPIVQAKLKRVFGILALAWALSLQEKALEINCENNAEEGTCSTNL